MHSRQSASNWVVQVHSSDFKVSEYHVMDNNIRDIVAVDSVVRRSSAHAILYDAPHSSSGSVWSKICWSLAHEEGLIGELNKCKESLV